MTEPPCAKCGAPAFAGASDGLCPACLLGAAIADAGSADLGDVHADSLIPGTTFGQFLIVRALGRGGMGAVYEALDTRLDRAVALKILPAEFLHDQTFGRRFEAEGRLVAKLEHPNIVPIYASGIEAGIPWMSMRLLAGKNLGVLLGQRRLTSSEAVQLLTQVAAALDYAHQHGVVHRDIKPSNILLDRAGNACVADFGLAQMVDVGTASTQGGIITGTPHYMAPEQALSKRVDHRCDIYALGIVAYEMLTGSTPFAGESPVAILLQHVHEPLPVPEELLGSRWVDVIERAAAKNPLDRWPSAGAFIDALSSALAGVEADAATVAARRADRFFRRRKLWPGVGLAAVVITAIVWLLSPQAANPVSSPPLSSDARPSPPVDSPAVAAPPAASVASDDAARLQPPAARRSTEPGTSARRTTPERSSSVPSTNVRPDEGVPPPTVPTPPTLREEPLALDRLDRIASGAPPQAPPADVFVAPKQIRVVRPVYPAAAAAAALKGTVVLSGVVGVDGRITEIVVERPVHRLLDAAARTAFLQFRYEPARRNGVAVPYRVTQTFAFVD